MKNWIFIFLFLPVFTVLSAQNSTHDNSIQLIIRADDIGSFHAANVGCIESYKNGIARSVEIMPPCAWFPEAVEMLKENPSYDVGVHLTLTSEWSNYKWRPITHCPSLVDEDGFFPPMVWKNNNFPPNSSIQEANWKIEEIEQELRAQIELSLKYITQVSHLSTHMGFTSLDPKIEEVVNKLAKEYKLEVNMEGVQRFPGWGRDTKPKDRIDKFCENLKNLKPGKYLFIEHPARDFEEMKTIGHTGSNDVAESREWVTRVFTSKKVKKTIKKMGIQVISYADVKKEQGKS
ncbi:MAG: polysaccharide deacetylase family protein [Mariniphaga sp.]|nr:polysaccharide deacetylase family protein [Mariniphaga sp.]